METTLNTEDYNLCNHVCGILYSNSNYVDSEEKYKININDSINILQNNMAAMASLGCRSIFVLNTNQSHIDYRSIFDDFIVDPICAENFPRRIKENLVPIIYMNTNFSDRKIWPLRSWLYCTRIVNHISGRVSKYVKPEKYIYSYPHSVFDIRECQEIRERILTNTVDDATEFVGDNYEPVMYLFSKRKIDIMRKLVFDTRMYSFTTINRIVNKQEKITSINIREFEDYKHAINSPGISSYKWNESRMDKWKQYNILGLSCPTINKETKINRTVRKGKEV